MKFARNWIVDLLGIFIGGTIGVVGIEIWNLKIFHNS